MIIMQHTSPDSDTIVLDDGTMYTDGVLNTVGVVTITNGQVETLDVNGDGVLDFDTHREFKL